MTKKLLLGLGTITAVAAPVATVVACGSDDGGIIHVTKPANKGSNTVIYTLVLPEATSPSIAQDVINAFSSTGEDISFLDGSSNAPKDDINEEIQAMVNWYYSVGVVTQTVNVSIAGDATPPTVVSPDPIDFTTLIDVDEINNIKTEEDAKNFGAHVAEKMKPLIAGLYKYFLDLFSDPTFVKWKAQLTTEGVDIKTLSMFGLAVGDYIYVGSTLDEIKAYIEKIETTFIHKP